MRRFIAVLAAGCLAVTAQAQEEAAPYKVIVHASNPVAAARRDALVQLFLNRKAMWANGPAADPVDLSMTSPVREAFSREVLGMPLLAVQQYWRKRMLDAREFPPMVKASDAEVIAAVGKSAGGIGYVSGGTDLPPTVKALKVSDPLR